MHIRCFLAGLTGAAALSCNLAQAAGVDAIDYSPYFGAAYEYGMLHFKGSSPYADTVMGYSPFVGVTAGKYFALEFSWRAAYGSVGGADKGSSSTTTSSAKIDTSYTTKYNSSMVGPALDLLVRLPLSDTGITPFMLTGITFGKTKAILQKNITTVTTPLSASPTTESTTENTTEYTSLVSHREISPEIGFGLSYTYSSAEVRVLGRVQNLNMNNTGEYAMTVSAGLVLHF